MTLHCLPQLAGSDHDKASLDDVSPTIDAELRAGHPGLCQLLPFHPVPPRGAAQQAF